MTGKPKPEKTEKHDKTNCLGCDYMADGGLCRFYEITGRSRLAVGSELYPDEGGGALFPNGGCNLKSVKGKSRRDWVRKKNAKGGDKKNQRPEVKPSGNHGRVTEKQMEMILEAYKDGMSDPAIAKEAGVSKKTVYSWRKRNGLKANVPHTGQRKMAR